MFNYGITIVSANKEVIYKNPTTAAYGIIGYMFDRKKTDHDVFVQDEAYVNDIAFSLIEVFYKEYQIGEDDIQIAVNDMRIRVRIIER